MFKQGNKKQLIIFLLVIPLSVFGASPISKSRIKSDLMNTRVYQSKKFFKVEVTNKGRMTSKLKEYLRYPYYIHQTFLYWEGEYGQVFRESVMSYYMKTGGVWIFEDVYIMKKEQKMVKGPNKSLPSPPQKPDRAAIEKAITEAIRGFRSEGKILSLTLKDNARFQWIGNDYKYAAYTFTCQMKYQNRNNRGALITWENDPDSQVVMVYSLKSKMWQARLKHSNRREIERESGNRGCLPF